MKRAASVVALFLFAGLFLFSGVNHFLRPDLFLPLMPPVLPAPKVLIYASGAAEILLGIGLLTRRWRRWSAWGLIALLVAVFPANVHMTTHPEMFPAIPEWVLWARLPLQGVLIAWAHGYTRPPASAPGPVVPRF